MIDFFLKLVYVFLIFNVAADIWAYKGLPKNIAPFYKTLQVLVWPFKRPFKGIFKTKIDVTSIAALLALTYIIDPLLRTFE